jgi:apolipoprotein N-acyltransferase
MHILLGPPGAPIGASGFFVFSVYGTERGLAMNRAIELVRSLLPRPAPWVINVVFVLGAVGFFAFALAIAWQVSTAHKSKVVLPTGLEIHTER